MNAGAACDVVGRGLADCGRCPVQPICAGFPSQQRSARTEGRKVGGPSLSITEPGSPPSAPDRVYRAPTSLAPRPQDSHRIIQPPLIQHHPLHHLPALIHPVIRLLPSPLPPLLDQLRKPRHSLPPLPPPLNLLRHPRTEYRRPTRIMRSNEVQQCPVRVERDLNAARDGDGEGGEEDGNGDE